MKKKVTLIIIPIALIAIGYFTYSKTARNADAITCLVKRGDLAVNVYTSGQLESEHSQNIVMPSLLRNRNLNIYEIKISDLVEEGTSVDSGQYVGALDRVQVEEQIKKSEDDLQTLLESLEDAQMDSTLNVSNAQDGIVDAQSTVEETEMTLKESVYESPAVIRKTQMDLDRAKRQLEQAKESMQMKIKQEFTDLKRKKLEISQKSETLVELRKALSALTIKAPMKGMIIYAKDNQGEKIKVGSSVNLWAPVIATLPDMSKLISRTYVNEIDISKVKKGQEVTIRVDAFSDKELKGKVVDVANVGQKLQKGDSKVFEVVVKVFGSDKELKPGMTTSNRIDVNVVKDTLIIPIDAVFSNDSMTYVYLDRNNSVVKQAVVLGDENENFAVVKEGLKEGDKIQMNEGNEANMLNELNSKP